MDHDERDPHFHVSPLGMWTVVVHANIYPLWIYKHASSFQFLGYGWHRWFRLSHDSHHRVVEDCAGLPSSDHWISVRAYKRGLAFKHCLSSEKVSVDWPRVYDDSLLLLHCECPKCPTLHLGTDYLAVNSGTQVFKPGEPESQSCEEFPPSSSKSTRNGGSKFCWRNLARYFKAHE